MSKLEIKKTPDLPAPPCCMYHKYVINFVIFFSSLFQMMFFLLSDTKQSQSKLTQEWIKEM